MGISKPFRTDTDKYDSELGAHPSLYVSVGISLKGSPANVREILKRLELVGDLSVFSYCYINEPDPGGVTMLCRVNLKGENETATLYDRLVSLSEQRELEAIEFGEALEELRAYCEFLEEKILGTPIPPPGAAVLGGKEGRERAEVCRQLHGDRLTALKLKFEQKYSELIQAGTDEW